MIVISDLVGTLTAGSPVVGLIKWAEKYQSKLTSQLYYASIAPTYFMAKWGLIDFGEWSRKMMVSSMKLIRDADDEKVTAMAEWNVENVLWPARRQDVIDRLEVHRQAGADVYIASSAYLPVVEAFANRIGLEVFATPTKIVEGRLRFSEAIAAKEEKINRVMNALNVNSVDFAYGDTYADIPMLEHAQYPVAVYPDEQLKAAALDRGWEIMGERE